MVTYSVDTKGHLISCQKLEGNLQIFIQDCAQCEFHEAILEIWPGREGEPVKTEVREVSLDTVKVLRKVRIEGSDEIKEENIDTGKIRQYDIVCLLPTRMRARLYASMLSEKNKGG